MVLLPLYTLYIHHPVHTTLMSVTPSTSTSCRG
ncbi:hypothetical protein E2C01_076120 [Portunus trituberculatus]|uniref:Uncharacterized protein n=1 Tax=Portunus trituberculatus TaxID=210409 RepID=A0A5B7II38_PORTR|nr:hypothetical protein [Portunus trituberculatus]